MKLLYLFIALWLLAFSSATAQSADLTPRANEKGKYGFVNAAGDFVIAPQYDAAQPFFQGQAIVRKGSNCGVINEKNEPVLPFKYNLISPADENTYLVAVEGHMKDGHLVDEKYGFISSSGQVVLKPEYVEMSDFDRFGLAAIRHKSGKCGFINRNYQFVVPAEFDFSGTFNSNGVTWINRGGRLNDGGQVRGGGFMLITADGNMFIPGEYASIGYFTPDSAPLNQEWLNSLTPSYKRIWKDGNHNYYSQKKIYLNTTPGYRIPEELVGFWSSYNADGTKNGVFDKNGNTLVEPNVYLSASYPDNNISVVITKNKEYNYLNLATNQLVLTKDIQYACGFQNGYAVCTVGNLHYIVDEKGGCCSKGYNTIFPGADGMHIVAANSGFGLIGYDGHEILPCSLTDIWPIKDGLCIVKIGSSFAYAGKSGLVTDAVFTDATNFANGYAWAKQAAGWDLYDTSMRKINKRPVEGGICNARLNVFWAKDSSTHQFGLYNLSDGSLIFDNGYRNVEGFNNHRQDVALVSKSGSDNSWGIVDIEGNELIPCSFEQSLALKAYDMYVENDRKPWSNYDTYFLNLRHNPIRNKFGLHQKVDESFWDF